MGRRPEQTFFQRRHRDGQQSHEKMLNIANHQRDANQNHDEISPHTCQMAIIKKNINNKCWRGCGEKGTVGGNATWCSYYGKPYGGSLKN